MKIFIFSLLLFLTLPALALAQGYQVYALRFASMGHPSALSDWADV